jgi:hypothetical protein
VGRIVRSVALAFALACAVPTVARASVELAGNPAGDQVLFHRVLDQLTRPLYVGTRAPGAAFGPLVPLTPGGNFTAVAALDEKGGAVAGLRAFDNVTPGLQQSLTSTRPPGGAFSAPAEFAPYAGGVMQVASNARGDAIVAMRSPNRYRFRPAGGAIGPMTPLPGDGGYDGGLAVDADGTAAFIWSEYSQSTGHTRTFESHRPPGGEFGPPVEAPNGVFPQYFASASNGRALVVWTRDYSIWASDRAPGGYLGPAFKVADLPGAFMSVQKVAVASSGAAAISFGYTGYYAAVRDPGGSFGAPQKISPRPVSLAVDDAGDVAAAWQRRDHSVAAAYRGAGGAFGPPLGLAKARRLAPGPVDPPALVLDGRGTATAAWEQSNGAKVATFTRSFDRTGTRPALRVDVVPSFVREGPRSECRPRKKADLLAKSGRATVFWAGGSAYACLLARGVAVPLSFSDDESTQTQAFALAGPLVAYANDLSGHSTSLTTINVTDLRDPVSGINRSADLAGPENTAFVPAIRLKSNGAVASIDCPDVGPNDSSRACGRAGGSKKRVRLWNAGAARPRLVDAGRGIDPRTLKLRGSRLTWKHGRRLRHAVLR